MDPTEHPSKTDDSTPPDDLFERLLFLAKKHRRLLVGGAVAAVAVWALVAWLNRPRPDPTRSRLAPGDSVIIHHEKDARIVGYTGTDDPVELVVSTLATVVSDAIPDETAKGKVEKAVGLGPRRPVKVRIEVGKHAGTVVTVSRGDLRLAR